ncbi:MAG: tRNA (adenosine(37)-N6)-threonylcarbamoyltransferase complex ATPase subunit type 1 TsaE [Candidatus Omnitrophica bacterium]|nr:tRNA (adenosine(37)-N6)-threonylcarbamoyltransferase complex ATPase subunit type 1 TsaE [Candidatus Omnitrophota bacterium]
MPSIQFISHSNEETIRLGEEIGRALVAGDILALRGDLGAGKTTFIRGVAQGLRLNGADVRSPTFTLMNVYEKPGRLTLYHFDLYRLDQPQQVLALDYEEYFYGKGVCAVEWAQKLGPLTPTRCLEIEFAHRQENEREIKIALNSPEEMQKFIAKAWPGKCPDCRHCAAAKI